MTRKVDREVLAGFIEEARGYLPIILEGLQELSRNPGAADRLEEIHRHVHTIKGASSMVGLSGLSHIAFQIEDFLEDVASGKATLNDEAMTLVRQSIDHVATYLDGVEQGTLREEPLLENVTRGYRRLRGMPEDEDQAAIDHVMANVAGGSSTDVPAAADLEPTSGPLQEAVPSEVGDRATIADRSAEMDAPKPPSAPKPPPVLTPASGPMIQDEIAPELLEVFSIEAEDHLRIISSLLPALRVDPNNKQALQGIRRSAHTLKGSAAMVGFGSVTQLSHRMEDLLEVLYDGAMASTPEIVDLLFASADTLEDLTGGKADEGTLRELYARYRALLGDSAGPEPGQAAPHERESPDDHMVGLAELYSRAADRAAGVRRQPIIPALPQQQFVRVPFDRLDELVKMVSELVIARTAFEQKMADFQRQLDELQPSTDRLRRLSYQMETQYEASALSRGAIPGGNGQETNGTSARLMPATFQTHGFDELEFDRYTEFHLMSRELTETTTDIQTLTVDMVQLLGDFDSYLNRQGRLTSELEDKLMRLRMVPLSTLTNRLQRTVRNVAQQQGKQVDLVIEGETTELDKNVLEEVAESLLHLLRNAVDHGIEPTELRLVKGKPERGTIRLRAFYEGSQVALQITDDGSGMEPQVLRAAAVQKGFLSAPDAAQLADEDALELIFLQGFSTASEVSEVSGRGLGMDIVKTNVHKLKGTLTLASQPGQGTTFTIRLPMTLAIARALLVKANNTIYALPLDSVRQILRLEPEQVERVGQETVLRLGGHVYRLTTLAKMLNLKSTTEEMMKRPPVLIVSVGTKPIALVVDELIGGREIVVKTLGSHLRHVAGITGATLMGDGSVVLIVNPADWVRETVTGQKIVTPAPPAAAPPVAPPKPPTRYSIMIVDDSPSVRRIVDSLIKSAGWDPIVAKDGLEALEIIHRSPRPPDLLLVDVEMPRMDGYELLATLKAQEAYRNIPVVMVTSRAGEKHQRKALDMGAAGYVVKPYQDEALVQTIRRLVQEARQAVLV
jgi:chemosensory pili system protein ChpA (sensor histidine kinase/response regulator)